MNNSRSKTLSPILSVLAYFDVFDYMLTRSELQLYTKGLTTDEFRIELKRLTSKNLIQECDGFFGLNISEQRIKDIIEGKKRAKTFTKKALKRAKFIGKFPYVRSVCISGSFSKGFMPADGDVDFFIITKHHRLWLARSILILYKKLFLFNSRTFFCVNYFISENKLELDQKNKFTATELVTLMPIVNKNLHIDLLDSNHWYSEFYNEKKLSKKEKHKLSFIQKCIEFMMNNRFGEYVDKKLMSITLSHWQTKFTSLKPDDFKVAFKTTRHVSKHHPSHFQKRVLETYQNNIELLISKDV
ncbi:MAG: nucleotidyltransferase domain-containing protein [Flavobacteriales bacterium]